MKFCNQCGKERTSQAKFCISCGQRFQPPAPKQENSEPQRTKIQRQRRPFKTRPLKEKIIMSSIAGLLMLFVIGYFTMSYFWSPDRLVEQLQTAIIEQDYQKVSELIAFDDESEQMSEANAQALVNIIDEEDRLAELLNHFNMQMEKRTSTSHAMLNLKPANSFLGLTKYTLTAKPYYITINSNLKEIDMSHFDQVYTTVAVNDQSQGLGPFTYGKHEFNASYENDYVSLTLDDTVYITSSFQALDFYFDISVIYIDSEFFPSDNTVYLNGDKIDDSMLLSDARIGPIDPDQDYTLEVRTAFPWGELSTGEIDTNEDYIYLSYSLTESMIEDVSMSLTSFYDLLFAAYKNNEPDQLDFLDPYLLEDFEYAIEEIHENVQDEDLIYFRDLTTFGVNEASLDIHYDDASDRYLIAIEVVEEGAEERRWYSDSLKDPSYDLTTYSYYLTYDDDQWVVSDRTGNYSYGSDEDSYIETDYAGDPIQLGTIKEVVETEEGKIQQITDTTLNYIDHMVDAINDANYSLVEPYILSGSPLEDMQVDLVDRLAENGTTQQVIVRWVDEVEQAGDEWFVYTNETIKIIYESGNEETKDFQWKYTVVKDGTDFKLTNIE